MDGRRRRGCTGRTPAPVPMIRVGRAPCGGGGWRGAPVASGPSRGGEWGKREFCGGWAQVINSATSYAALSAAPAPRAPLSGSAMSGPGGAHCHRGGL